MFTGLLNGSDDSSLAPYKPFRTGEINALGLMDEIFHHVIDLYKRQTGETGITAELMDFLRKMLGDEETETCMTRFVELFPPEEIRYGKSDPREVLTTSEMREAVLEEMILVWIHNRNQATERLRPLVDCSDLESVGYAEFMKTIRAFFDTKPGFGPDNRRLIDLLRNPAEVHPDDLGMQLTFIRERWGLYLSDYSMRLLTGLDLLKEENKPRFAGPGPPKPPSYAGLDSETERFSRDDDWMGRTVLIAKNVLVWLHQLSRSYGVSIERLDQIPERALEMLADRGFTALWLIGLWRRSPASRRIKRDCGNPEAEASAYAINGYEISDRLGGRKALERLRESCNRRGIRLACDMVPNHTGIDSRWVLEHPEWFIRCPEPPFLSYSYTGPDLSEDRRARITLEDHYYDRSDAAVTFERVENETGTRTYLYHGNDGTGTPWNDTAQLDFLNPRVREAVMEEILRVAEKFPIIRFDAAMVLTKRHIRRLWHPEPGSGGDIPSRAEHPMSDAEFETRMPEEFWRQVVDRISRERPGTLLLAEAFWMMEGYFVRNLGMHRVYNSAFMNMLKQEKNSEYRRLIKETVAFDPKILERFVNFMNNPDEETAVAQFGSGDKYFGICAMMATMPGMPMFGHGQMEGLKEKYGMEYARPYLEETADVELLRRHEAEIVPLLRARRLFAGSSNFRFYDFIGGDDSVCESVFAYTNDAAGERTLFVYNNRGERVDGTIKYACNNQNQHRSQGNSDRENLDGRIGDPAGDSGGGSLADAIGVSDHENRYCIYRELRSGFWYVRACSLISAVGFPTALQGYEYKLFAHFREEQDGPEGYFAALAETLQGGPTDDIDRELQRIILRPAFDIAYRAFAPMFLYAFETTFREKQHPGDEVIEQTAVGISRLIGILQPHESDSGDIEIDPNILEAVRRTLNASFSLPFFPTEGLPADATHGIGYLKRELELRPEIIHYLAAWSFVSLTARFASIRELDSAFVIGWLLDGPIKQRLSSMSAEPAVGPLSHDAGIDAAQPDAGAGSGGEMVRTMELLEILPFYRSWYRESSTALEREFLAKVFADPDSRIFLGVNEYEGVLWYDGERFHEMVWWLFTIAALEIIEESTDTSRREMNLDRAFAAVLSWLEAEGEAGYRVNRLLGLLRGE